MHGYVGNSLLKSKTRGSTPPLCLEKWKDMFHIAVRAKHKVDIRDILDGREPEYIEPDLQDAEETQTQHQSKKKEKGYEKSNTEELKDHEARVRA